MRKRILALLISVALLLPTMPVVLAEDYDAGPFEDGYYTYVVVDGQASIVEVDASISGDITIPNILGGYPAVMLNDYAFGDCTNITSITVPDNIQAIDRVAFGNCTNLCSITLPNTLLYISTGIFIGCSSLSSIIMAPGNESYYTVDNCLINSQSKELIAGCKTSVIPTDGSVISIGIEAFDSNTGLKNIIIPDSISDIEMEAFSNCTGLTSVIISDSVTAISNWAFYGCESLTDVYYTGTKEQWEQIAVGDGNEALLNVTIHFNSTGPKGDISGDGVTNASDALLALKHAVGKYTLTAEQIAIGDLDGDGRVNAADALIMLKIAVGKITL